MAYFFKKNFVLHKFSIDSISVRAQVCLITQETKIQKPGCQQPVHQEPCDSVFVVATGHMSISPGLVLDEIPLLLALL